MDEHYLYELLKPDLEKHFQTHGAAISMETVESQKTSLPACWIIPIQTDADEPRGNDTGPQFEREHFAFLIKDSSEDLSNSKKYLKSIVRGLRPPKQSEEAPRYEAFYYGGGNLRDVHSNKVTWTEIYITYTLGGC